MKLPTIYEEFSTITVIDHESMLPLIMSKDPLKRALMGYDIFGAKAYKIIQLLNNTSLFICKGEFEPFNRPLGPSPKTYIKDTPKLELKSLPYHIKYASLVLMTLYA